MQDTFKKLPALDITDDLVTTDDFGNNAVRVEGVLETIPADVAAKFFVANVSAPLANTEYSWAIPDGAKNFKLQLKEGDAQVIIYSTSGASDVFTIPRGVVHEDDKFDSVSNTIYFKVSKASKSLEILYWI